MRTRNLKLVAFTCCLIALLGCAAKTMTTGTTPTAPTPPQVTAVNAVATLAGLTDAGAHACATAYSNGSMSQSDFSACSQVVTALATAGPQIDAELRSADPWAASASVAGSQQAKIIAIIQANALAGVSAHVSPAVSAIIAAALTAANQLSVAVGGPAI